MKPFRFPLQPLLEYRERIERDHRVAVARAEADRRSIESSLADSQDTIAGCKLDLREALGAGGGPVDLRSVRLQSTASFHMQVKAQRLAIQLAGAHQRLEGERAKLAEAAKARRAVELLKERRRQEWLAEQTRREIRAVDELATMAAARRRPDDDSREVLA